MQFPRGDGAEADGAEALEVQGKRERLQVLAGTHIMVDARMWAHVRAAAATSDAP
ncbi:MAG: hypothetical protein K0U78_17540 [Actinomycetia bacterium]|nr:hypothetical protein [Actinomycetes bacterium]